MRFSPAPTPLPPPVVGRYLRLLGLDARAPDEAFLRVVVAAHLCRVPFENVSKLWRLRREGLEAIPDIEAFLDGIERFRFGGTCYSNNLYLARLLASLGFDVALCGAAMSRPDVHVVALVRLGERVLLADGGYGAPFLEPMPLDLDRPHELARGADRYVLHPRDDGGRSRMDLIRDGRVRHGYVVNPMPRRVEEFERVVAESFASTATFMNAVVIARHEPSRSRVLQNRTLVESEGERSRVAHVSEAASLPEHVERWFGMPAAIVREAIAGMDLTADPWG